MSPSDEYATRDLAELVAYGDPGVEIQVLDADYRVRGRGTDELRLTLPEGVYMVDWIAGGQAVQKVVRLLPIEKPLEVRPDTMPGAGPAEALTASSTGADIAFAKSLDQMALPSVRDHGSEVAVIIRAQSLDEKIDLSVGLRLLDPGDVAMRSDGHAADVLQQQTSDGYACRLYHVPPGDFRLRYVSMSGEILDQTVPALKDRRTVVFMSAGTGKVMMANGDAYEAVDYQGVDPGKTVMVSVPRAATAADLTETARLGELLLHDLAFGRGSLGAAFVQALDAPDGDPLLRIYAAAVALTRIEQGGSPALDETWPTDPAEQAAFTARWRGQAVRWLTASLKAGAPPDATAMLWRLQADESLSITPPPLTSPPMLECAWTWAVARSTHDAAAIPASVSFRAAGRSIGGTAPWLTWRASSAKGEIEAAAAPGAGDLRSTIEAVAAKVKQIVEVEAATRSTSAATDPLAFLSQDAKAVAVRTFEVTDPWAVTSPNGPQADPAKALASLFGAPAAELQQKLLHALGELEAGPPTDSETAAAATPGRDPPALMRRILHQDDPNKGRFGGHSERDGLVLSAVFKDTKNKNWARVELTLEDRRNQVADGETADLFLHDSFKPDRIAVVFRDGKAHRAVTSWGGFTVGAWIPSRGVELELDLAEAPGAPRIIRER